MASSKQLGIGPMGLERVATAVASPSNLVATVDLCGLLDQAFRAEGYTAQLAGGMLGMSPQSYSKAINPQYVDNPVMKRLGHPDNRKVLTRWLSFACEASGVEVHETVHVRVLRDLNRVLKAVGE